MMILITFLLASVAFAQPQNITLVKEVPGGVLVLGTVGTPTANPAAGTYSSAQTVTFSAANADHLVYTTDGSTPNCSGSGTAYTGPVTTGGVGTTTTYKVIGCPIAYWNQSAVATLAYSIVSSSASDSFTGADLSALSANWTANVPAFDIKSNGIHGTTHSTNGLAHWNARTFTDNQYAALTIGEVAPDSFIGPAVRVAAAANTGYFCRSDSTNTMMYKVVAGTFTQLGSTYSGARSPGDVLRIEASGTSITCKVNGSVVIGPITDSAIASGYGGVSYWDGWVDRTYPRGDDWTAGDL